MAANISDLEFAKLLRQKARAGDPEVQHVIGDRYLLGDNVKIDYAEALKWYRLAVQQGHADAQNDIGSLYENGLGVDRDIKEAVKWYELSAKQESALARFNLAFCYLEGSGVAKNVGEAFRLLELSAMQGYWYASKNYGRMYEYGLGVKQDFRKAKFYYEKALKDSDFWQLPADTTDKESIQEAIDRVGAALGTAKKRAAVDCKSARTEVFISYAHKDIKQVDFVEELRPHLAMLKNITKINYWYDDHIKAGDEWEKEIKAALAKAKVAVLFCSADFFASKYIWDTEYPQILEMAKNEGATILWVPVSFCIYEDTGITKYQSVITDLKKPLATRSATERAEVYTELAKSIKDRFKN